MSESRAPGRRSGADKGPEGSRTDKAQLPGVVNKSNFSIKCIGVSYKLANKLCLRSLALGSWGRFPSNLGLFQNDLSQILGVKQK